MTPSRKSILLSLLITAVGVGWLLNAIGVIPSIDWVWTIGLGIVALLVLFTSSLNRISYIVGFFLLLASVMSVLRQTNRVAPKVEIPMLVIGLGLLTLTAELLKLPLPAWMQDVPPARTPASAPRATATTTTPS